MNQPLVRSARSDECYALLELYRDLHEVETPAPDVSLQAAWSKMQDRDDLSLVVVETENCLVASCMLCLIPNLTRGARPFGQIENVVTRKDYRRRGYGLLVVRHAIKLAWKANAYKVMLMTGRKDAGTMKFYEACGFDSREKTAFIARAE